MSSNKFYWLRKKSEITCIYYLLHKPSNRKYIGKTRKFQHRISSHLTMLKNKTHHTKSIKHLDYDLSDWSFGFCEVFLGTLSDDDLFTKEVEYWEKQTNPFNTKPKRGSNRRKTNDKRRVRKNEGNKQKKATANKNSV